VTFLQTEKHDFSDRIALGRYDVGAARGLAGTIARAALLAARSSVAKHTRSIFFDMWRPFRPLVSLQRVGDRR
jgi:hypothetical protein